jgi:hypothetical protein
MVAGILGEFESRWLGLTPAWVYILLSREKLMAEPKNFLGRMVEPLIQMGTYDVAKYMVLLFAALL